MNYPFNILLIFGYKRKIDNFDPYSVLLAIATNIPGLTYDWFCGPGTHICFMFIVHLFAVSKGLAEFAVYGMELHPLRSCGVVCQLATAGLNPVRVNYLGQNRRLGTL